MGAPKGNTYGIDSGKFFKPKKYSPNQIKKKFFEYLEYNSTRTVNRVEAIKSGDKAGTTMTVPLKVPLTKKGFALFLGMTYRAYQNYSTDESYKEYFPIVDLINDFIENEQIEGTSVGLYNSNIIARLQSLKDRTDITSGDEPMGQFAVFEMPDNGRYKPENNEDQKED